MVIIMVKDSGSAKNPIFTRCRENSRDVIKLYDYDISHLWLAGLIYAHIGYWVENLFRLVSKGVLDSRNQLLPFLFCYTIAMWAAYFALGTPKKARFLPEGSLRKTTKGRRYSLGFTISRLYFSSYSSGKSLQACCLKGFQAYSFGITAAYRST